MYLDAGSLAEERGLLLYISSESELGHIGAFGSEFPGIILEEGVVSDDSLFDLFE